MQLRDTRGQSLVEFALIVPLLLILVFGIIDFGLGLRTYISVSAATREGARYGVTGNTPGTFTSGGAGQCNGSTTNTVVGKVCATLDGLKLSNLNLVSVQVCDLATPPVCAAATTANMTAGESLRVSASYDYHYITPVRGLINLFSAGAVDDHLTIKSTTDMRIE